MPNFEVRILQLHIAIFYVMLHSIRRSISKFTGKKLEFELHKTDT